MAYPWSAGDILTATDLNAKFASLGKFGGTGADGALSLTSGTTTLAMGAVRFYQKNYTSISITGTGKLAFSGPHANGTIIVLKSQGAGTLTSSAAPIIDASGMGGSGGAGAPTNAAAAGSTAVTATSMIAAVPGGIGGSNSSSTSPTQAANPAVMVPQYPTDFIYQNLFVSCGSGGGGGGASGSGGGTGNEGAGGDGGRGGGALIIEIAGALNFTTASGITVAGLNGNNGAQTTDSGGHTRANGGGGGGGGGGCCVILYGTLTANSGTIVVSDGTVGLDGAHYGSPLNSYGEMSGGQGANLNSSASGWSLVQANTTIA